MNGQNPPQLEIQNPPQPEMQNPLQPEMQNPPQLEIQNIAQQDVQNPPQPPEILTNPFLLASIPPLSGKNHLEFFETLDAMGNLSNWSNGQKLVITKLKLEGPARVLFMSTLRDQAGITFQGLKTAIATHFTPSITVAQGISKLTSANQGPNESVQDFAVRVEGLAKRTNAPAEFTTQLIFSQFISGLRQDIKTQIHIQNPRDFTEALQTAIRVEKVFKDITINVNSLEASASAATRVSEVDKNAFITVVEALTNRIDSLAKQVEDLALKNATSNKPRLVCQFCNNVGHSIDECRKKLYCEHCRKQGHSIQNCFKRNRQSLPQGQQHQGPIRFPYPPPPFQHGCPPN